MNAGTLIKSGGTADSVVAIELVNTNAVTASTGTLLLTGGDGAGSQTGNFTGSGAGTVEFGGGVFDVAALTMATLDDGVEHSFGTLEGAGTWRVNGAVTWTGGTQAGTGQTLVVAGETLTKSGSGGVSVIARTCGSRAAWS